MGKTRGRTIAIIIVALAAAFAAQTALRDSADAVLLGGAPRHPAPAASSGIPGTHSRSAAMPQAVTAYFQRYSG